MENLEPKDHIRKHFQLILQYALLLVRSRDNYRLKRQANRGKSSRRIQRGLNLGMVKPASKFVLAKPILNIMLALRLARSLRIFIKRRLTMHASMTRARRLIILNWNEVGVYRYLNMCKTSIYSDKDRAHR